MNVWQLWHDKNPPNLIAKCLKTTQTDYPELRLLSLDEGKKLANLESYGVNMEKLSTIPIPNQTCFIRFALLHQFGGIWIDADYISLRRYEPTGSCALMKQSKRADSLWSSQFIFSEPNNPLIEQTIKLCSERLDQLSGEPPVWGWFGSHAISLATKQVKVDYSVIPKELIQPCDWNEMSLLLESDFGVVELEECYGIMFAHSTFKEPNVDSIFQSVLNWKLEDGEDWEKWAKEKKKESRQKNRKEKKDKRKRDRQDKMDDLKDKIKDKIKDRIK